MLNLFKKKQVSKPVSEIIEEIHETFYTEVDRLLESALKSNSLETVQQDLIDKCNRLKAIGFTNTKEVKDAEVEISRLNKLRSENEQKKEIIEAINYFSFSYPMHKFITEESVKKICEKYGLVYGEISRYNGEVPYKNLKHIEDFKIKEEDEYYMHYTEYLSLLGPQRLSSVFCDKKNADIIKEQVQRRNSVRHSFSFVERVVVCPLEIAAPKSDFNMEGLEIKDFKISNIEIPDPIVLKPVIFKGKKHYLIVTAWGIEASDELVVNPVQN